MRKLVKVVMKSILWIVGIWTALLIVMEVVLTQSVLTGLVNKYAAEYIDGDLRFGKVNMSMFRRFPNVSLTLEDFSITYPADRFDLKETEGIQSHLIYKGCGQDCDTLASFKTFSAAVNLPALLTGNIHVPYVRLDRPRIFAHSYVDGTTNWDIFKLQQNQTSDSEGTENQMLPSESEDSKPSDRTSSNSGNSSLSIGKIWMSGNPYVVYTDSRDTIFAGVTMKRFELRGNMASKRVAAKGKVGLTLDSLFVAGRLGLDTLAFGMDHLYLHEGNRRINVDAAAKAFMATNGYGRMMIPVNLNGSIAFPEKNLSNLRAEKFTIDVASIPVVADADVRFSEDGFKLKGDVRIDRCNLKDLIDKYAARFVPEISRYSTDVFLGMDMSLDITSQEYMRVNANLKNLTAQASGLSLSIKGAASDITGNDPDISMEVGLDAVLDSLTTFLPDTLEVEAHGTMSARMKGNARLSQLSIYNFSNSNLSGSVLADNMVLRMPADSISAVIDSLKIVLGPEEISMRKDPTKKFRLMGVTGTIAKADVTYKDELDLKTEGFLISAKNSMDTEMALDSIAIHPFSGSVSVKKLSLKDSQGTSLLLGNSKNSFRIMPKRGKASVPTLTLSSRNERIYLRSKYNRLAFNNANLRASAAMNSIERKQKAKVFMDSLSRKYPDIPRDSLYTHLMKQSMKRPVKLPSWMKEDDFRKQDIDISLDKTLAKYFREWDLDGGMEVDRGMVMTPYFPLRNTLGGFDLKFTNDEVAINKFQVKSGDSNISATGKLTGLRRALLGRKGALRLNVNLDSEGVDANQLLAAYTSGINFNPANFEANPEETDDEEFLEKVLMDSTEVSSAPALIVVPGNLLADIKLKASDIKYSDLLINTMTAELLMKERCVQITDTKALTNMGDIFMEGFYSTQSKKDLKAGFSINFKDITAEKVITLMPAVDTLMPLLKSFGGLLNCEFAATARLDTNMNIIMPSINGVMRIGGDNMTVTENDMFNKLAKVLMFRNKKKGQIDKMTVEGVIKDSRMEVFPFILEMDRYMLGLSGVQNMDMSFRYHASLIKSPLVVKLGMDVYGPDFDNLKFKLGRAKYKSRDVPVFSDVIDDTKINLVESIRHIYDKGVDAVISENSRMLAIEEYKKKIGYVQAVDQKLEELSPEEQSEIDAGSEVKTEEQTK